MYHQKLRAVFAAIALSTTAAPAFTQTGPADAGTDASLIATSFALTTTTAESLPQPKVVAPPVSLPATASAAAPSAEKLRLDATRSAANKWELAYLALSAIDTVQTIDCLKRDVCYEANPLFGKNPKASTLIAAKVGAGLLHYGIFRYANARNPKAALRLAQVTAAVQGTVVFMNLRFTM